MNEKMFTILVKDEDYTNNRFVLGQLTGVAKVMFGMTIIKYFNIFLPTNRQTMTVRTTESNYKSFIETIEKHFPDMCEFDVKVDEELIKLFG
jgi:hypothetical protein